MSLFRKIALKILGALFIFVSAGWLAMKLFWPSTILDGPGLHAHLNAKEVCSCVFVEELDEKECEAIHFKIITPSELTVDREKKTVFARTYYAVAKAEFINEFEGCRQVY
jgi:hypothetical protein